MTSQTARLLSQTSTEMLLEGWPPSSQHWVAAVAQRSEPSEDVNSDSDDWCKPLSQQLSQTSIREEASNAPKSSGSIPPSSNINVRNVTGYLSGTDTSGTEIMEDGWPASCQKPRQMLADLAEDEGGLESEAPGSSLRSLTTTPLEKPTPEQSEDSKREKERFKRCRSPLKRRMLMSHVEISIPTAKRRNLGLTIPNLAPSSKTPEIPVQTLSPSQDILESTEDGSYSAKLVETVGMSEILEEDDTQTPIKDALQESDSTDGFPPNAEGSQLEGRLDDDGERVPSHSTRTAPSKRKAGPITDEEKGLQFLQDPKIRALSTLNPNFLESFFKNSRLHHLSAWKSQLKKQFMELVSSQPTRRSKSTRRYILHVDFDSFFAAVALLSRPDLKDKPVCVCHGSEKGSSNEIASCNYVARSFGVKNGMWMRQAKELCPDLTALPYDFNAYERASKEFYTALLNVKADRIQSVSIDEALLDITSLVVRDGFTGMTQNPDLVVEFKKVEEISKSIRDDVRKRTGCEVSVGCGGNIFLAKIALRKAKPAGQYHLTPDKVLEFLEPMEVKELPGVGGSTAERLAKMGITTVGAIRAKSMEYMRKNFGGKTGENLYNASRGIDKTEVGDLKIRQSVSVDVNWGVRFENTSQVYEFITALAAELAKRLEDINVKGRNLMLKVMTRKKTAPVITPKFLGSGHCDTVNKSKALSFPTADKDIIAKEAIVLMKTFDFPALEIRGLSLQMVKLEPDRGAGVGQQVLGFAKIASPAGTPKKQKSKTPPVVDTNALLPTASQLDVDVLQQLPEALRNEILEQSYKASGKKPPIAFSMGPRQALLTGLGGSSKKTIRLTQGRHVSPGPDVFVQENVAEGNKSKAGDEEEEIPPGFDREVFYELPPEIRKEILEDYKRQNAQGDPHTNVSESSRNGTRTPGEEGERESKGSLNTLSLSDHPEDPTPLQPSDLPDHSSSSPITSEQRNASPASLQDPLPAFMHFASQSQRSLHMSQPSQPTVNPNPTLDSHAYLSLPRFFHTLFTFYVLYEDVGPPPDQIDWLVENLQERVEDEEEEDAREIVGYLERMCIEKRSTWTWWRAMERCKEAVEEAVERKKKETKVKSLVEEPESLEKGEDVQVKWDHEPDGDEDVRMEEDEYLFDE